MILKNDYWRRKKDIMHVGYYKKGFQQTARRSILSLLASPPDLARGK